MLEVTDLTKNFSGFVAVDVVAFHVAPGARHAIIGPNGAGKTTFFNLISGLFLPDRGEVVFMGTALAGKAPHEIVRLGLARSFQKVNIFPRDTVFENVQVAVLVRERGHRNLFRPASGQGCDEVCELLEMVGLAAECDRPARELAHGKQKQLELAVTLAARPKMLLLDEPTAGMSAAETDSCITLVGDIVDRMGITLLFTEHDMGVVFGLADSVSVLHHGRLIAEGNPDAVRRDPEVRRVYLGHD